MEEKCGAMASYTLLTYSCSRETGGTCMLILELNGCGKRDAVRGDLKKIEKIPTPHIQIDSTKLDDS